MTKEEIVKRLETGEDPLDLSIQKWVDIILEGGVDMGHNNCALCLSHQRCEKCVVNKTSKGDGCSNTPYEAWNKHQEDYHDFDIDSDFKTYYTIECYKCLILARKELEFLRGLKKGGVK